MQLAGNHGSFTFMSQIRHGSDGKRPGASRRETSRTRLTPADGRALLKDARFFSNLAPDLQARLTKAGKFRNFVRGAILWRHGESAKHVYVLMSGRIGVLDAVGDERTAVISLFEPGHFITGASGLCNVPYAFTGQVIDEARVLVIPVATYRRYVMSDPDFLLAITMSLAAHWRELMLQVRDLKQLSANQRLGFYLLAKSGKRTGTDTIHLTDDQMLIAGMLGVTRESLSRSFAQLHEFGVLKRARVVTLADVARLRRFCEDPR